VKNGISHTSSTCEVKGDQGLDLVFFEGNQVEGLGGKGKKLDLHGDLGRNTQPADRLKLDWI